MEIRRGFFLTVGVAFFASLLMVTPASAANDEIEAQIKALEQEVSKIEPLKDQIERLRSQQIELKKDATAAAAALPSFSYRPGRGLTITAADKSWSFNTTYRLNMYMYNILQGKPNFSQGGDQIEYWRHARGDFPPPQPFVLYVLLVGLLYPGGCHLRR